MLIFEIKKEFIARFSDEYTTEKIVDTSLPRFGRHDIEITAHKEGKSIQLEIQFSEIDSFNLTLEVSANLSGLNVLSLKGTNHRVNSLEEVFELVERQLSLLDEIKDFGERRDNNYSFSSLFENKD